MKKLLLTFLTAIFALTPQLGLILAPATAQAASTNTIIKGTGSTLYWYASNGKRYVFPNVKTFYSWYSSTEFSRVQTVADTELYTMPLGGNVTYRPGAKLVKVVTDPKVYAVSRYGTLRWVTSEYLAQNLYGSNWRQWVEDVPDTFFSNYTVGSPIYSASEYNVSNEYNQVITPSNDIRDVSNPNYYYNPNQNNSGTGFNASSYITGALTRRVTEGSNETIDYTASLFQTNTYTNQGITIQIYNERNGQQIWNCSGTTSCTVTLTSNTVQNPILFARAIDQQGRTVESQRINVSYGYGNYSNTFTGNLALNTDKTDVRYNEGVTFSTILTNSSAAVQNVTIHLYDAADDHWVKTCAQSFTCATNPISFSRIYDRNTFTARFYAVAVHSNGQQLPRAYSPTITIRPDTFTADASVTLFDRIQYEDGTSHVQIYTQVSNPQGHSGLISASIYDERDNELLNTFSSCLPSCTLGKHVAYKEGLNNTYRYYAILRDQSGQQSAPIYSPYLTAQRAVYTAALSLGTNGSSFPRADGIPFRLHAIVSNLSIPVSSITIKMYEVGENIPLAICTGTAECLLESPQTSSPSPVTKQYYAILQDSQGTILRRAESVDVTFYPTSGALSGQASLWYSPASPRVGDNVIMTAALSNTSAVNSNIRITLYDERQLAPVKVCEGVVTCSLQLFPSEVFTQRSYSEPYTTWVYATFLDTSTGQTIQSERTWINVTY